MTTELATASTTVDRPDVFVVRPRVETLIPTTPFVVWHDGDGEAYVQIMDDGALDLSGATYWIVGLAATWRGAR